jgi:mono/diheme cytochrome c family protein
MKSICTAFALLAVVAIADGAVAADVDNGQKQYVEFGCYACHGFNGTGERPLVPAAGIGVLSNETVFLRYLRLRADQNPVNPKRTMPNYSAETLSDGTALDIYAYLLSLEDSPPDLEDIPAFQALLDDAREEPDDETENR